MNYQEQLTYLDWRLEKLNKQREEIQSKIHEFTEKGRYCMADELMGLIKSLYHTEKEICSVIDRRSLVLDLFP